MPACLYFHPEGYTLGSTRLMGRQAAGASYLRGLLSYSTPADSYPVYVEDNKHIDLFQQLLDNYRRREKLVPITKQNISKLQSASTLFLPGPKLTQQANWRVHFQPDSWSLCGITHTTSSANAMDAIADWITAPVQEWDAVICTSTAVKKNVEVILQAQVDALKERLGISKIVLPQLPIIPLGIHTSDFQYNSEQRANARARLQADNDALIVLYTGRLSFHAKAHPLAMYQALEHAAQTTGKNVILVECGWHANEYIEKAFAAGAELVSPSVKVITLDGRVAENRETAWASADIFCSLSDNIQETFGIVPIEAMAAGLPVVVSDWDGYKDTVRDGIDGFRIPTISAAPGLAGDLAYRHALEIDTYDMYCGHSSSLVAIHAQKLTQAFIDLFLSPELRKKMGEAGRLRATQDYDWRTIIPRYEELWEEQSNIRLVARNAREKGTKKSVGTTTSSVWPARLDPTISFANYPTQHLTPTTQLTFAEHSATLAIKKLTLYRNLAMVNYAHFVFPTDEEIQTIFEAAEKHGSTSCSAELLIAGVSQQRRAYCLRGLAWLCKLGFFHFS